MTIEGEESIMGMNKSRSLHLNIINSKDQFSGNSPYTYSNPLTSYKRNLKILTIRRFNLG